MRATTATEVSALVTTGSTSCFQVPKPVAGSQPSLSENRRMHSSASQKFGMAANSVESVVTE